MKLKFKFLRSLFFISFLFHFSCSPKTKTQTALRIISLSPAVTEILYAIKADNRLVGVTSYCDWPPGARLKEKVGDFSNPSIEKIASLKPDIILAAGDGQGRTIRRLIDIGYPVKTYQPENITDLFSEIIEIGNIMGKGKESSKLVRKMKEEIKKLPKKQGKTVFIEVCSKPLIAAGKKSFLTSVCGAVGLHNICDFPQSYPQVSVEWLIKKKPEVILLTGTGEKEFLSLYPFFDKTLIISGINPDILVRPSPRIIEGMWELVWRLSEAASKPEKNDKK